MARKRLLVPGRYDRLEQITEFVAQAAQAARLGESDSYHCQVAVDEACTNIIMHAYGGEDRGQIEVTCESQPGTLTVILADRGRPFDPLSVPEPDLSVAVEDRGIGGLGVHLMRQMMDEVTFQPGSGAGLPNRVILVKHDRSGHGD